MKKQELKATLTKTMVDAKTGKKTVGKPMPMKMTKISEKEFMTDGKPKAKMMVKKTSKKMY